MDAEIGKEWAGAEFQLVYREAEHSFLAVPKPEGGITSVLFNDLQLEVDDEGTVLYAWGLFPRADKCQSTNLNPPSSSRRRLQFVPEEEWIPGASTRLNKTKWDVFANQTSGWVGLGEPDTPPGSVAVEFAPDSIAVLQNKSIVAIWLKPKPATAD